jgi:hypothetical protein
LCRGCDRIDGDMRCSTDAGRQHKLLRCQRASWPSDLATPFLGKGTALWFQFRYHFEYKVINLISGQVSCYAPLTEWLRWRTAIYLLFVQPSVVGSTREFESLRARQSFLVHNLHVCVRTSFRVCTIFIHRSTYYGSTVCVWWSHVQKKKAPL